MKGTTVKITGVLGEFRDKDYFYSEFIPYLKSHLAWRIILTDTNIYIN
jgi:hypothetical protein